MYDNNYWNRLLRRRLTRRRALQGAVLGGAGLATAAVLGCEDEEGAPGAGGTPEAGQPRRGGIVTRRNGFETLGNSIDPHRNSAANSTPFRLWYQGLLTSDPRTLEVKAQLAQKWEEVSETEFVFTLQPGVKWHNKPPASARPLIANDVVFSLERVRTDEPRYVSRSTLETVDKIQAVNDSTVRITLKEPDAAFVAKLAGDGLLIMAPEVVAAAQNFLTPAEVVGTGAFIMTSLQDRGGSSSVRNPDYWEPGLPYLDEFRTVHFGEDDTAYAAWLAGQLDVTFVPGPRVQEYIARLGPNVEPDWAKNKAIYALYPNTTVAPFGDRRVWHALRLLIDHQEMITAFAEVFNGRGRHGQFFPGELEHWGLSHEEYEKHLEWKPKKDEAIKEALALLSAAGFTQSNPLRFELLGFFTSPGDSISQHHQLLQAQWKRTSQGVLDPDLKLVDLPTVGRARAQRAFTVGHFGNSGSAQEPDAYLTQILLSKASRNYTAISDPKLDGLIGAQRREFNLDRRRKLIRDIDIYLIDNYPGTIMVNSENLTAVNPKVHGVVSEPLAPFLRGDMYKSVWREA